jgi:hypothetical protein
LPPAKYSISEIAVERAIQLKYIKALKNYYKKRNDRRFELQHAGCWMDHGRLLNVVNELAGFLIGLFGPES